MHQPALSPAEMAWFRPGLWCGGALLAGVIGSVWVVVASAAFDTVRFGLVWASVVAAGIGVALTFRRDTMPPAGSAPIRLLMMAAVFGLTALGATALLIASWGGSYWLGLRPGLCLISWLFVAPVHARAAWLTLRRLPKQAWLEHADRCALSLLAASLVAVLACVALTTGDPERFNWITIQHFLFVASLVALAAAPLTVVDRPTRRAVVSGLILFHFGGILTACLGGGPTPWIVNQVWVRIYRPYLQFMYLNNAYHFYSPEPGPPSFLWFRLYYEDAQGTHQAEWYKVPTLHDNGQHGHSAPLEYQRLLSLTENTIHLEKFLPEGDLFQRVLERRLAWTPDGAKKEPVVGQAAPKQELLIPLSRARSRSQQFYPPQIHVQWLLESYARHVIHKHEQKHPDRTYTSVRIYRVIHEIPPIAQYLFFNLDPTDPELYVPIYFGEYGVDGKLRDKDNPFLYWHLPIQREPPYDTYSPIKNWARRHAGDPYWKRAIVQGFFVWVDDDGKPEPPTPK